MTTMAMQVEAKALYKCLMIHNNYITIPNILPVISLLVITHNTSHAVSQCLNSYIIYVVCIMKQDPLCRHTSVNYVIRI